MVHHSSFKRTFSSKLNKAKRINSSTTMVELTDGDAQQKSENSKQLHLEELETRKISTLCDVILLTARKRVQLVSLPVEEGT